MMLLKCCAQFSSVVLANLENSAVVTEVEKVSFHSNPKERQCQRMLKLLHNCNHLTCFSSSKVIPKILQARLQQYMSCELLPTSAGSSKKTREFQKNIYFCFIDYAKAFDCVDHNKLKNSERDGHTRPPILPLEKSVCRSGSNN